MKKMFIAAVLAAALFCVSAAAEEYRMVVPTDLNYTVNAIYVYAAQQEDSYVIFKAQDVNGGAHGPGFSYMKNYGYVDLAAGGKYERFCCSYMPGQYMKRDSGRDVRLIISADGNDIYRSALMNVDDEPVWVDVDIAGTDFLRLTCEAPKSTKTSITDAFLYNGSAPDNRLYGESSFEPFALQGQTVPAEDTALITRNNAAWRSKGYTDLRGNFYGQAMSIAGYDLGLSKEDSFSALFGYADFLTDGTYDYISGVVVCDKDGEADDVMTLCVYADGRLVYRSMNLDKKTKPLYFRANIQGADTVRITAYSYNDNAFLYVCNACFGRSQTGQTDGSNGMVSSVTAAEPTADAAYTLIGLINNRRAALGLPQLEISAEAMSAAQIRAEELASSFSAIRPGGGDEWSALREAGIYNTACAYAYCRNMSAADYFQTMTGDWAVFGADTTGIGVGAYNNGADTYLFIYVYE